jgi:hypothetical protein
MKKFLIVLGILALVGIAAAAFGLFSLFSFGKELKPKAVAFLKDLEDGKVDEAYGRTSSGFKASKSPDDLRELIETSRAMMGKFLEAGNVSGTHWKSDGSGSTGEVKMTLRYERGETEGTFQFVKEEGDWRLSGFRIPFPEGAKPQVDHAALEAQAKSLMDLLKEARDLAFYDQFSSELKKAWPAEKFQKDMTNLREKTGTLRIAKLTEKNTDEEGKIHLRFDVEFDNTNGKAEFTYDLRGVRGGLIAFELGKE